MRYIELAKPSKYIDLVKFFVPVSLQELPIFQHIQNMVQYIILEFDAEFSFVSEKKTPNIPTDAVSEVIKELGFAYITSVSELISGAERQLLVYYVSLINSLKGTRLGIEIVLRLLGFSNATIREWWETGGEPFTYDLNFVLGDSVVPDNYELIRRLKSFSRAYIYALVRNLDFKFTFRLAEGAAIMYGFTTKTRKMSIIGVI